MAGVLAAILTIFVPGLVAVTIGLVLGVAGVVLGVLGLRRSNAAMSITGLSLSGIAVLVALVTYIVVAVV